jgi:dihydrofolate reductase
MGKITTEFTMSLDGFIAGPNDDVGPILKWYFSGDTDFTLPGMDRTFKISRASADLLRQEWSQFGAMVTGRRDFDVSNAWGGQLFLGVPTFIVTHHSPPEWANSPFIFVTDGVESAIEQARIAAGDKTIGIGGTTIVQQCLKLGLLDEIHIDLAPILLGSGIRLFDNISLVELEQTRVIQGTGVTHIRYRVCK